jgi:small subunit ribosomal protein S19e
MSKKVATKSAAPKKAGSDENSASNGATVKDVPAGEYIQALAAHFKKSAKIEVPDWADIVKTGTFKELCPQDPDWYFVRAASIARRVYLRGGVGVGEFARIYGGLKSNGARRPHYTTAATGVIRHILQQLQELDLVAKKKDKKGRYLTRNGQRELDTIAGQLAAARKA